MKYLLLFLVPMMCLGCSSDNTDSEEDPEEIVGTQDKYYVQYSASYCSYDNHYIKYRDVNGDLIAKTIHSAEEQKFEVGPVSPIFQAYIEGSTCVHTPVSINIYVRKNNQEYIRVATESVHSTAGSGTQTRSLTYSLREYD